MVICVFSFINDIDRIKFRKYKNKQRKCVIIIIFIKLMQVISVIECESDSMDSEDLERVQKIMLSKEGPSLNQLYSVSLPTIITPLTSLNFIQTMTNQHGKQIKYIGSGQQGILRAYYLILLITAIEQKNSYPHLTTIIRQKIINMLKINSNYLYAQQFGDGINQLNLKICENYFETVHQWNKIEDYILQNKSFQHHCMTMITTILSKQNSLTVTQKYKYLSRYFNIDCCVLINEDQLEDQYQCFLFGKTERLYIVVETQHVFVLLLGLQRRQAKKSMGLSCDDQSKFELPMIIQISDKSTPKFIIDQDEPKQHRRSHKNSFGGDVEIMSYKDLNNSINKDKKRNKVFSERFETQQIFDLQKQLPDKQVKKNNVTTGSPMKGSHLQPILHHDTEDNHHLQVRRQRKKKLSSSAIQQETTTQKVELFNVKISFSKHDRHKFVVDQTTIEMPEKAPSENYTPNYKQILARQIREVEEEEVKSSVPSVPSVPQGPETTNSKLRETPHSKITHPHFNANEMTPNSIIQLLDPSVKTNLKNRKYSSLTQEQTMTHLTKRPNNAFNRNLDEKEDEFHRIRRGESKLLTPVNVGVSKRKFEENSLSLSRLQGKMNSPSIKSSQGSNKSSLVGRKKNKLVSDTFRYQYIPQNPEPFGWIRKEVTYYYDNKQPESRTFTNSLNYYSNNTYNQASQRGESTKFIKNSSPFYLMGEKNRPRADTNKIKRNQTINYTENQNKYNINQPTQGRPYSITQNHVVIDHLATQKSQNNQHWRKHSVYTTIRSITQNNNLTMIQKQGLFSKENSIRQENSRQQTKNQIIKDSNQKPIQYYNTAADYTKPYHQHKTNIYQKDYPINAFIRTNKPNTPSNTIDGIIHQTNSIPNTNMSWYKSGNVVNNNYTFSKHNLPYENGTIMNQSRNQYEVNSPKNKRVFMPQTSNQSGIPSWNIKSPRHQQPWSTPRSPQNGQYPLRPSVHNPSLINYNLPDHKTTFNGFQMINQIKIPEKIQNMSYFPINKSSNINRNFLNNISIKTSKQ